MRLFTQRGKTLLLTAIGVALLTAMPAMAVKYVAVVESDIDAASGASADLTSAEVRLITTELRREAVKNLPSDKYNVMTSETVQSMGGAVLEECSEENCVIALGSKIGADFIVRGTISKFKDELTLSIEIYNTDNGNLVASSDPVRSENAKTLLEKASVVCSEMFKTFVSQQSKITVPAPTVETEPQPKISLTPKNPIKKNFWIALGCDVIGAGLIGYGLIENGNVKDIVNDEGAYRNKSEYEDAKKSVTNRNVCYVVGSALLAGGISIHIFF